MGVLELGKERGGADFLLRMPLRTRPLISAFFMLQVSGADVERGCLPPTDLSSICEFLLWILGWDRPAVRTGTSNLLLIRAETDLGGRTVLEI